MGKILVIAEKPSLGRSIAGAISWWKGEKFERQGKDRNTWLESDAIVNIKTGEVLVDRVHDKTCAIDDVDDYNKFLPYARKQVRAWETKDGKMIFYILPPIKKKVNP